MKKSSINILIVALILSGLMAIALFFFLENTKEDFPEKITVSENGVTESLLPITDLRLKPTDTKEYSVNLVCDASGDYLVSLDYVEKLDRGMKSFVVVTVSCDGEIIYYGSLTALLDTDLVLEFERTLSADDPTVINFKYHMPREIGNEAQGTYSDFNIKLTIKKS